MEEELKYILKDIHDDIKEIKSDVKKQNDRVRKLEIWRGYLIGIGTAIAFAASVIIKLFWR